eukprot:1384401-Pyramimonas_sp.AAC.2
MDAECEERHSWDFQLEEIWFLPLAGHCIHSTPLHSTPLHDCACDCLCDCDCDRLRSTRSWCGRRARRSCPATPWPLRPRGPATATCRRGATARSRAASSATASASSPGSPARTPASARYYALLFSVVWFPTQARVRDASGVDERAASL